MARAGQYRVPLVIVAFVLLATLAVIWYSGSSDNTGQNGGDCQNWCGNGSAQVTIGGSTTTISGGGCYDQGSSGVDGRFGDWQGVQDLSNYVTVTAYHVGGPTAPPAATGPGASSYPADPAIGGSVYGQTFAVYATVMLQDDGTGSFSGADVDTGETVSGTFSCH